MPLPAQGISGSLCLGLPVPEDTLLSSETIGSRSVTESQFKMSDSGTGLVQGGEENLCIHLAIVLEHLLCVGLCGCESRQGLPRQQVSPLWGGKPGEQSPLLHVLGGGVWIHGQMGRD